MVNFDDSYEELRHILCNMIPEYGWDKFEHYLEFCPNKGNIDKIEFTIIFTRSRRELVHPILNRYTLFIEWTPRYTVEDLWNLIVESGMAIFSGNVQADNIRSIFDITLYSIEGSRPNIIRDFLHKTRANKIGVI